jgi:hypothetical protein
LLAQPGIDLNEPNNEEKSPINNALFYGHVEIVSISEEYQKILLR